MVIGLERFARRVRVSAAGLALALLAVVSLAVPTAAGEFYLHDGDRVVFFGDSITQAGQYVDYVDVFLAVRRPQQHFEIINHGISSETISGTSEDDHKPRRPDAHERFDRDIAAWKPQVVVACFGMNDGNYHPFDQERFEKYQAGIERLIERTEALGARLTLLTPPPFDAYQRKPADPNAKSFGYKFPSLEYDRTLDRYSSWLMTLNGRELNEGRKLLVVDIHKALNEHLARRRQEQVSFTLAPDGVHPGPTGHWLMARELLLAWGAKAKPTLEINAGQLLVIEGAAENLKREGKTISFDWLMPPPMPGDMQWDPDSVPKSSELAFNLYTLRVTRLAAERYEISRDGKKMATVPRDMLVEGLGSFDLVSERAIGRTDILLERTQTRNRAIYDIWRKQIAGQADPDAAAKAAARLAQLDKQLQKFVAPQSVKFVLTPIAE